MTNVQRSRRQVRLSRALGIALTPKAQRIFEKRPYAPGEHGRDRRRTESDYAVRMREKQRLRAQYGISEKQLRAAYEKATRTAGQTGNAMLTDLETRLDNVVFRLGFARTRKEARQTVRHGHFTVNGKRVDIPSYRVKAGDVIAVGEKFRDLLPIKEALISSERFEVPGWLEVDIEKLSGNVISLPSRDQISGDINEQLIVELYSK